MNRVEFMGQLERLLWDIPENDRQDAIAYYNDYFDAAGVENEAQIIQKLGSPGKVAATIKADLHGTGNEQTEYTESGCSDGQNDGTGNTPANRARSEHKQKRSMPWPLIIILIVFASPVLLGVGGGLLGGLLGLFGALFGIVISSVACAFAFLVAGFVCFVVGLFRVAISPVEGLITIGMGSLLLALGLVMTVLFIWVAFKWIPALFRGCVNLCQRLFHRGERRS